MVEQVETLRIVELKAENFKRIRAVRITPNGAVVQISGRNGQGKSSVLDAIAAALGGGKAEPEMPIRRGTKKATVKVDLGSLTVEWGRTSGAKTLVVTPKDGHAIKSPQAVLDTLVGALTFDPLTFARMSAREQLGYIKDITGLSETFKTLDAERAEAYEFRTGVGRLVKQYEGQLAALPIVNGPDTEESVTDLLKERDARAAKVRENAEDRAEVAAALSAIEDMDKEIGDLEARIAKAQANLAEMKAKRGRAHDVYGHAKTRAEALVDPDVTELDERIRTIEVRNKAARQKQERAKVSRDLDEARAAQDKLTRQIAEIDAKKLEAVSGAKLPIDGLGMTDEGVTYQSVPFSSCSASERLRVSVAIGLAMNPKIRVMLVRDGSLLDSDAMADLARIAEEHNAQVWVERVSDAGGVGVVIEDGEVVEVARAD